jgi:chemotaxis protein methyltransferase CheR
MAAMVLRETSMVYEPRKEYLVEARLHPLALQAGCATVDAYVAKVAVDPVERRKAIDALTINETSWFRDNAPYQAFAEQILPDLLATRPGRHLRIWSAACSSGQEAYSIAMLLDQHLPAGWTAEILATDVSTAMVARVEAGRYSQVEMNRGLPAANLVRYFTRVGTEWEIVPRLRSVVHARNLNLATPYPALGRFDLVLLRNVLIYFDQPTRHDILRRMHQHVAGDGYLLLGSSETTLDLPADLTALWDREQLGRVQAHRPAGAVGSRTVPAGFPTASPLSAALPGA